MLIEILLDIGLSAGRETSRGYASDHTRKLGLDARTLPKITRPSRHRGVMLIPWRSKR